MQIKKAKRVFFIALAAIMMATCCSLNLFSGKTANGVNAQSATELFQSPDRMVIGGYYMPQATFTEINLIKQANFDYMVVDAWQSVKVRTETGAATDDTVAPSLNSDYLNTVLGYFNTVDLKAVIMNPHQQYMKTNNSLTNSSGKKLFASTSFIETDYTVYPAFAGFEIVDEFYYGNVWTAAQGGWLPQEISNFKASKYKDYLFSTNAIGYGKDYRSNGDETTGIDFDYYISRYFNNVIDNLSGSKWASFDYYPFNDGDLEENYLRTYDIVANLTKTHNAYLSTYVRSIGNDTTVYYPNTRADLEFQIFVNLAFGAKGYRYFVVGQDLIDGADAEGLIGKDGYPTRYYYYAQELNGKVRSFDELLFDYTWQGIIPKNGTAHTANITSVATQSATTSSRITASSATEDTLIGVYSNTNLSNPDAYIIMNYSNPYFGYKDTVSITFNNATSALVYDGGDVKTVSLANGVFTTRLNEGEGIFVIPQT